MYDQVVKCQRAGLCLSEHFLIYSETLSTTFVARVHVFYCVWQHLIEANCVTHPSYFDCPFVSLV